MSEMEHPARLTSAQLEAAIRERIQSASYAELCELTVAFGEALRVRVGALGGYVEASARGFLDTIDRAHGVRRRGGP